MQPSLPQGYTSWADLVDALGPVAAAASLHGAFAIAEEIGRGRMFLAVDRFAQETLCWRVEGDRLHRSPRAVDLGSAELDIQAIFDYLFFHSIPSPRTVFRDVHRLPPGHCAISDGAAMTVAPYWRPRFTPESSPSFGELKAEFRQLLENAVRAELTSGIPACFLSGGTDSSTMTGLVKQIAGEVHAYSIGFDAEGYDEMEYARIAARHFGAVHHEYYVTPDDLVEGIPLVAAACDQPFGNSSILPAYCCALRARNDGVSKLIAGDGGDELFGGNARYATQRVYAWWWRVPGLLREALVKPALALPGMERLRLFRRGRNYVRDAELGLPGRLNNFNLLLRLGVEEVLAPAFLAEVRPDDVLQQQQQVWALAHAESELDRQLAFDWRYTLAESDLPKVRAATALAGLGVGYPMLHDALVGFSMKLPEDYKLRRSQLRWFFKEALRDFLPPEIITKSKKGFGLPFGVWATRHSGLHALTSDSLRSFAGRGVVRSEFVDALLGRYLPAHPGYYGEMVWVLMMLEQWLRAHMPDWRLGRA